MTITLLALVSQSDPQHLIISLHSCLSYAFLVLYLDGKLFDTRVWFSFFNTAPSIYTTQSQIKMSSDTEMMKDNCVSLFLIGNTLSKFLWNWILICPHIRVTIVPT